MSKRLINDNVYILLSDKALAKIQSGDEVCYEEITSGYSIYIKKN